jgi:hypothetical protein
MKSRSIPRWAIRRQVGWFAQQSMVAYADFLAALDGIPEGDGTLLDNCLIFAHSDCSIAKAHAVEGIPMMIAGVPVGAFAPASTWRVAPIRLHESV